MIGDEEMARINIEASAALAQWIELMRADDGHFRKMVKAAQTLPMLPPLLDKNDPFQSSGWNLDYLFRQLFVTISEVSPIICEKSCH